MDSNRSHHRTYEDVAAMALGTMLVSFGTMIYAQSLLLVGSMAGLALLLHYATGAGFWLLFFLLNLPFYVLAWKRMGRGFAIRTFVAVCIVCVLTRWMSDWVAFANLNPLFATIIGGALIGTGLLILFRHRIGLGGVNILALFLQERFGVRAGYVQLAWDGLVLLGACFVLPLDRLVLSVGGAVIANMVIAMNHRPDRYIARSAEQAALPTGGERTTA
ncbi:YitT family protein [Niveispirillum sp.]|uniref:YitT family protein n=1 Tax=Niveispirillum sp. TaxID=1917217 RepID=UPI001B576E57|nr:YitT family protein [Niveispirillum sp.]MBP7339694.1 YitT family protein [Niveispirillum sp.]